MSTPTSPVVPPWKTEYDRRMAAFSQSMGQSESQVLEAFKELGVDGSDENSLTILDSEEFLPFGDLRSEFVEKRKLTQIARLRLAMSHLRGNAPLDVKSTAPEKNETLSTIKEMFAANRPKSEWSVEELLKALDPDATEVVKILSEKTRGRPCIILNPDGSVNVEASLDLVKLARKQPTGDQYVVGNKTVRVRRVGDWLPNLLDESPFAPGRALVKGYCADTGTDWTGISHEARVLAAIYVRHCERGKTMTKKQFQAIVADAKIGSQNFRDTYAEAAMVYDELQAIDKLPKLKLASDSDKKDTGF